MTTYTFDVVEVEGSPDDLAIQLTDEFCKENDWQEGDVIVWEQISEACYNLINKTKKERAP